MFTDAIVFGAAVTGIVGLIGWAGVILYGSRKSVQQQEITISLQSLATIWLPYNKYYEYIPPSTSATEDLIESATPEIVIVSPASPSANNQPPVCQQSAPPVSEMLRLFWNDCVEPYQSAIAMQGVTDIVRSLIDLIEEHGQCSSIALDSADTEVVHFLASVRDNLAKITLREHTYSVARHLLDIVKERYNDAGQHIPKALVTALAHDIGKIPAYRLSGAFNTTEHHLVSAQKLMELFIGKDVPWLKDVVRAVESHHAPAANDNLALMLREADRYARRMELLSFTKDYEIKPFQDWFSPAVFIERVLKNANVTDRNGRWNSFTFQGILYTTTDHVYSTVKDLCNEKKILDDLFLYHTDKDSAMRRIIQHLRKADRISSLLHANAYAMSFNVYFGTGSKKFTLVPIQLTADDNIAQIEARKEGILQIIKRVTLASR